jgi:hypothetical protein
MSEIEKISKEHLSLAGEFAVASELCRRGIYTQLTLGTRKKTDLLIDTESKMARIQVKTKNVGNWPFCKGIYGDDIVLVFVDYQGKRLDGEPDFYMPDFYILTSKDWETLVKKELEKKISKGEVKLNSENCPIYINRPVNRKGNRGMDVTPRQIAEHRGRWEKIEALVKRRK